MTRRKGSQLAQARKTRAELFDPVTGLVPWLAPRQLEYWIEQGWIIPDGNPAQGRPRVFSDAEKKVLRTMARLVRAGFPAASAAVIARRAVTLAYDASGAYKGHGPEACVELAGGDLLLVIRDI